MFEHLGAPLPSEVKYSERPDSFRGLHEFMRQFKPPFGIVVTKDYLELKEGILYVPLWLFLLLA